jgi:hypothetical protein
MSILVLLVLFIIKSIFCAGYKTEYSTAEI